MGSTDEEMKVNEHGKLAWFVLLTFCLCSIGNAMAWLTFAPIPTETTQYYGITTNQVDMFSIVFMIVGIPVGLLAIYLVDRIGLRTSIQISVWFNLVGSGLRISTLFFGQTDDSGDFSSAPSWCYPVAITATAIISVSQAFILICPTKLAAQWFQADQRLLANSFASLSNPLGIMLASILAPILVSTPEDIKYLHIYFAIPSLLAAVMSFFITKEGIFPSMPELPFKERLHILFVLNRKYFLFIAFLGAYGLGQFSAVLTLMVQFLCPHGYSNTFASAICASAIIGAGLVFSLILSFFIDGTERHVTAVKILMPVAVLGSVGFSIAMNFEDNEAAILVACIVYGGAGLAAYPICCELTVETTYPVGEGTSTGIFVMFGQLLAALFVIISAFFPMEFIPEMSSCSPIENGQNLTIYLFILNGLLILFLPFFMWFYKCEYKRKRASKEESRILDQPADNCDESEPL